MSSNQSKKLMLAISDILGAIPAKEAILAVLGYKTSRLGIHPDYYDSVIDLFLE